MPAASTPPVDDLFALMLAPVPSARTQPCAHDVRFRLADASPGPSKSEEAQPHKDSHNELFRSVITYTNRKTSERLHPIDAKRKLEKYQKEMKRAKLARRAARQQRRMAQERDTGGQRYNTDVE